MKLSGLYRYRKGEGILCEDVIISARETKKSFIFELVENRGRYYPPHLEMMFSGNGKCRISKDKSPHAIMCWYDGTFTIYPYRDGIPFYFDKYKDPENNVI